MRHPFSRRHGLETARLVVVKDQTFLPAQPEGTASAPVLDVESPAFPVHDDGPQPFPPQSRGQAVGPALERARAYLA